MIKLTIIVALLSGLAVIADYYRRKADQLSDENTTLRCEVLMRGARIQDMLRHTRQIAGLNDELMETCRKQDACIVLQAQAIERLEARQCSNALGCVQVCRRDYMGRN